MATHTRGYHPAGHPPRLHAPGKPTPGYVCSRTRRGAPPKRVYYLRGRASNRVCLLGTAHNVWCSMASVAVAGATMASVGAVGSVVFGTVLVQQWLVWWAVWCMV